MITNIQITLKNIVTQSHSNDGGEWTLDSIDRIFEWKRYNDNDDDDDDDYDSDNAGPEQITFLASIIISNNPKMIC